MDDQGRIDKLCCSFVLKIFDFFLPSLFIRVFPYHQGWANQQASHPCPGLIPRWLSASWNFHSEKGHWKPATSSCWGTASGLGAYYLNRQLILWSEPFDVLFRKDLKKYLRPLSWEAVLQLSDPAYHPFNSLLNKSLWGGGGVAYCMCGVGKPCCPASVGEPALARSGYSFESIASGHIVSHRGFLCPSPRESVKQGSPSFFLLL